jgi:glycine cleavage system H protein
MNFPADLKYTKEHEWVRVEGNEAVVGITDHAQNELGEIVYIEVETVGNSLKANDVFGTAEAVKATSELFMPISGVVLAVNESLKDEPELVNDDPYGDGWIIRIQIGDLRELGNLMDADAYQEAIA